MLVKHQPISIINCFLCIPGSKFPNHLMMSNSWDSKGYMSKSKNPDKLLAKFQRCFLFSFKSLTCVSTMSLTIATIIKLIIVRTVKSSFHYYTTWSPDCCTITYHNNHIKKSWEGSWVHVYLCLSNLCSCPVKYWRKWHKTHIALNYFSLIRKVWGAKQNWKLVPY